MALHCKGFDTIDPFDIERKQEYDIRNDQQFEALLRLAWSGIIGLALAAPPCRRFSILKLRRPGPKALRTPERMNGVPGLSSAEQKQVDDSSAVHA